MMNEQAETTKDIYGRFRSAFSQYREETARLHELSAVPDTGGAHACAVAQQSRIASAAEDSYRIVRMEYALSLLSHRGSRSAFQLEFAPEA